MKRVWKRIAALILVVVMLVSQVPVGRIQSYAADPVSTMVGEELAAWVLTAIAAACGIQVESSPHDLAADYEYFLKTHNGLTETDYQLLYYAAGVEGVKVVGREAFDKAADLWDSLVDGTYSVVNGGIAVASDMIDTVSAYFSDRTQAYTPSFQEALPYSLYAGVCVGPYSFDRMRIDSSSDWSARLIFSIPSGLTFCRSGDMIFFRNMTSSALTVNWTQESYYKGEFYHVTEVNSKVVPAGDYLRMSKQYFGKLCGIPDAMDYGLKDTSVAQMKAYLNGRLGRSGTVARNEALDESMPWDNWTVIDGGKDETGEKAEIIPLYPNNFQSPDDFNKHLADALVAGELLDMLEDIGLRKKSGSEVPTPTTAPDESESPSVDPSESPSVNPSESPAPEPSVNPEPEPSQSPGVNPSESPSESPGIVPSIDPSESPGVVPSIDPSQNPDPGGNPDFSLSEALQSIQDWFKNIGEKLDQIMDPFTVENMEKRKLKDIIVTRFPFCIPFDLINCFRQFEATVIEPRWEIPLEFRSIGVSYTIILDLTQFPDLVALVRVFVLLSYILGLILATRALIKG